jgi:large subunit ribosomal protein L10
MSKVRPDKVATVDEVATRVATTTTAVVTEYRGLSVAQISSLRRQLRSLGADYKVFKNTLVRRAIAGTSVESLTELLEGPTAIAFIDGDVSAVAKALRDFARETPTLVVKGGVLNGRALTKAELTALADLPSRDVLLAQMAGLLASPLRTLAGLLKALPQNLAFGLSALIDAKGGPVAPAPIEPEAAETPAGVEDAAPAAGDDPATEVAPVAVDAASDADATDTTAAPNEDAADAEATAADATDITAAPSEDAADAEASDADATDTAAAPIEDAADEPTDQ